ncbi:cytochrome P450 [Apiospora hydei]|uniref:Cytochrome P450 n=1 Tax=Apiospora hydei TaxID=1337664 RepID=A0ABR1VKB0_9PEZI
MPNLQQLGDVKPAHLGLAVIGAAAATGLLYFLYPGPKLWAASRLPYLRNWIGGHAPQTILELHHRYGEIVRVAPDELSFLRPDAWKEIMGYIPRGVLENEKDPLIFRGLNVEESVIGAPRDKHRALRSVLSHGFSASRMLDQQPIIMRYIDLLVERLREKSKTEKGEAQNMVLWYNYATFDIIGDLSFGESFGCLESSTLHPWVAVVFSWLKLNAHMVQFRRTVPWLLDIVDSVLGRMATEQVKEHMGYVRGKLTKRLNTVTDRPDFVDSMLRTDKAGLSLTRTQLEENANLFIVAGSETTATTLSFTSWLLLTHPHIMTKVTDELFATFSRDEEIDLSSVNQLKYMVAMFEESLRLFPPVPVTVPRITPPGGRQICGEQIPENTKLGVWHYPMYHHADHFAHPEEFHPERWLGEDPRFAHDRKEAFEPFSHGSRNCLGKNLAYAEMRTIMARMLFNFDMRLAEGYETWAHGMEIHNLYEKPPLFIHLTPRGEEERARLRPN